MTVSAAGPVVVDGLLLPTAVVLGLVLAKPRSRADLGLSFDGSQDRGFPGREYPRNPQRGG